MAGDSIEADDPGEYMTRHYENHENELPVAAQFISESSPFRPKSGKHNFKRISKVAYWWVFDSELADHKSWIGGNYAQANYEEDSNDKTNSSQYGW